MIKKTAIYLTASSLICLCYVQYASAQNPDAPSDTAELTTNMSKKLEGRKIKQLSRKLCNTLSDSDLGNLEITAVQAIEAILVKYSSIHKIDSDYEIQLANFWNINANQIICGASGSRFPEQHFFSRIILQGFGHSVMSNYFFKDVDSFPIDPNVVAVNQYGQQETVLDYIDRILASPNAEDNFNTELIENIKKTIENKSTFNGKRVRELENLK